MGEVEGRRGAKQAVLKRRRQVVERRPGLGFAFCPGAVWLPVASLSLHALRRWLLVHDALLPPLDQVPLTAAADFHLSIQTGPSYSLQDPVSMSMSMFMSMSMSMSMECADGPHARPPEDPYSYRERTSIIRTNGSALVLDSRLVFADASLCFSYLTVTFQRSLDL
ncbi:hypothetical protein VTN02DRAFT_134 [Thermoascus thermophilus]